MQVDDDSELGIDFDEFLNLMTLNTPLTEGLGCPHGENPVLFALHALMHDMEDHVEVMDCMTVEKALVRAGVRLALAHEVVQASLAEDFGCHMPTVMKNITEGKWAMVRVPVLLWHNIAKFREAQLAMYKELQSQQRAEGVQVRSVRHMMERRSLKLDAQVQEAITLMWHACCESMHLEEISTGLGSAGTTMDEGGYLSLCVAIGMYLETGSVENEVSAGERDQTQHTRTQTPNPK